MIDTLKPEACLVVLSIEIDIDSKEYFIQRAAAFLNEEEFFEIGSETYEKGTQYYRDDDDTEL